MIYTKYLPDEGEYLTASLICRTLSTPLFDAASISITFELPGFMKPENYLKNAEMAMEDDYGMIDGVINNGKSPAAEEKPSVLGKLKEQPVIDTPKKSPRHSMERDME